MNKRSLGREMEEKACAFLEEKGYKKICSNFYTKYGEIDLIMKDGRYIVFIEVKYRKNTIYGNPYEAVDRKKQWRIINSAKYYFYKNKLPSDTPCRFDVVSIAGEEIIHYKNAFTT